MSEHILVLTTVPEEKKGRALAEILVRERLAACATLSGPGRSVYWWKDKMCEDREFVLLIKTRASLYPALEKKIKEEHPYEVPEIIAFPVIKGSAAYLAWIDEETHISSEPSERS